MVKACGFITAGGRSSRMGRDKAWLELDGRPMIERVIEALKPITPHIHIIANSVEYSRLGLPVIADTNQGIGPLEAIRTALANSPTEWALLVGCDMPFVTSQLFARLLHIAAPETSDSGFPTADSRAPAYALQPAAVVPLNAQGLPEPLCAAYSIVALPTVTEVIASGGRKVSFLFERLATRLVAFDEMKDLPACELFFENINTPEDFENVQKSLILRG